MPWHLFVVSDGTRRRLVCAETGTPSKAEELVTFAMVSEREFDPQLTGAEYIGILDRDVDLELYL